jgi:hypothetical protein
MVMKKFDELEKGDRIKTLFSGMATVIEVGCYSEKWLN